MMSNASRFVEVGGTRIDTDRSARTGLPEVVFAEGKTLKQTEEAVRTLWTRTGFALATRVAPHRGAVLVEWLEAATYHLPARALRCGTLPQTGCTIAVLCAGTSDLPVLEEAAFTLESLGHTVVRRTDVGVAGVHRLFADFDEVAQARAVIVVAGMEGALPSVVAGLVRAPVIAVPTSVGYGTALGGITPLLAMLTSCAPGIGVVNIDNGFGAAALAHKIVSTA